MNPSLPYFCKRAISIWTTRRAAVRRLAANDAMADPPANQALFAGQRELMRRCEQGEQGCSYYVGDTFASLLLAATSAAAVHQLWVDPEPTLYTHVGAAAAAGITVLALYRAIVHRMGPAVIDQARLDAATQRLEASGDQHARPMPLGLVAVMAAMFVVDGTYAGITLATAAFEAVATPKVVTAAAMAFSCASAWLLFHLTKAAALEAAVNGRRRHVRNLLESPRETERSRGDRMLALVGSALDHDLRRMANRFRARLLLAMVVLGLTGATMAVRLSADAAPGTEDGLPAVTEID